MAAPSRRWVLGSVVAVGFVVLALLSSRVGPPRSIRLTIAGPEGLGGEALVARGSRGALPFTIELLLRVEPEHEGGQFSAFLDGVVPGSDGALRDGIEPRDKDGPAIYWVHGERHGLTVETGFEIEAWAADGTALRPLGLESSPEPGVARLIRVGPE